MNLFGIRFGKRRITSVGILHERQVARLLRGADNLIERWDLWRHGGHRAAFSDLDSAFANVRAYRDDCLATIAGYRAPDPPVVGYGLADRPQGFGDCVEPPDLQKCTCCGRPL